MRTLAFGSTAAAASVLLGLVLSGCSIARGVPDGPSDAQVVAAVKARLDRQWRLSGLEGIVERPRFEFRPIVGTTQWASRLGECMADAEIVDWGYDAGDGLFIPGDVPSASQQLQFYWCFEKYPTIDLLTREQTDFIYDYYAHWLIPCLESSGLNVMNAPSRAAFRAPDRSIERWSPYGSLERYPPAGPARALITQRCPPTVPGIEGWSEQ